MANTDMFVAFIPLRGGSKSIPNKNIKEVAGQPLAYWVIDAAVNATCIEKVYISTDSEKIKNCIAKYHKKNGHKIACIDRSPVTATDEATTESAMLEFAERFSFENMMLIQATSPLLTTEDIDVAIKKFKDSTYDSLLSVVKQKRFIWEMENETGVVRPKNYNPVERARRQDQNGFFVENGAFYLTKKECLLHSGVRVSGKIGYYEMPEDTYFEIDEPNDWIIVEELLKNRGLFSKKFMDDLSQIKLFAMDCDGVLTDAGMYYTETGDEMKKFNTRDGMGIGLLHRLGFYTAIITGENTTIVKNRAVKLGVHNVYQGVEDKVAIMERLLEKYNLTYDEVAYVGDDMNDIELLKKVKCSFSVHDAIENVKNQVRYVTTASGGNGAVREIADLILLAREGKGEDEF